MIGREVIESTEQMEQKAKRQRGNPCGQERAPHVRKLTSIQHRGAARGWMRLIGPGLPAAFPPSPSPFIYELYHPYSFLPPFPPFVPPHHRPARLAGLRLTWARRRALTRRSALLRRLLNISIKFCLSARPDDLPWRAREERRALHGEPWNGYRTQSCISEELAWRWPGHEFNISPLHLSFSRGEAPNSIPEIWNEWGFSAF